jgi:iron complex outermembrane recepter protein
MTRRASLSALRCGAAAWALAIAMSAPAAYAQTADGQTPGAEDTELETIVVTGSRIARPEIESPIPVTTLGQADLAQKGTATITDALNSVPALFSSITNEESVRNGANPIGVATLNLRGLGDNRTLVLVNGRRHVAGVAGSAAVDINSIPDALIERTDVMTGGASTIYGADAVTGVVNFILKKDFQGFEGTAQIRGSDNGDAWSQYVSMTGGLNFGPDNRGNVVASVQYSYDQGLRRGDRDFAADRNVSTNLANPDLRFQTSDLTPAVRALGARPGDTILGSSGAPRYAGTPQALVDRARNAIPFSIRPGVSFSISSFNGRIGLSTSGNDYASTRFDRFVDLNDDGTPDCVSTPESRIGYGCLVYDPALGGVRPFRDGVYASSTQQFDNPDGAGAMVNRQTMVPRQERIVGNLTARYEVAPLFKPFIEAKFSRVSTTTFGSTGPFNDVIPIKLDNPYIPADLLREVNQFLAANPTIDRNDARVVVSRDFPDLNGRPNKRDRETIRIVGGFEGEFENGWAYDVTANYGRTKETLYDNNARYEDRFFAAVDAIRLPNGNIVCRSSQTPTAIPEVGLFPEYTFGFRTFSPTDGSCRPINIFGEGAPSAEAVNFVSQTDISKTTLTQFVASANLIGDSSALFELWGGPIKFATGGEYRQEKSSFIPSDASRQLLTGPNATSNQATCPITAPFTPCTSAGGDIIFSTASRPTVGDYSVWGTYIELNLPVVRDIPFVDFFGIDLGARYDKYDISTNNKPDTFVWKALATYAPIPDIRVRGGYNKTVRTPNISELFDPQSDAFFAVNDTPDPCSSSNIGPSTGNRARNCQAAGIPAGFTDNRSARTRGLSGGNPGLDPETSKSWTVGVVLQPRFLPGFSATVDYWNFKIEQAINPVPARDILANCYDGPALNPNFCSLFSRDANFVINSITQSPVNYARSEASGIDWDVRYRFDLADIVSSWGEAGSLSLRVSGTYVEKLDDYASTTDPNERNPELREQQRPQWAFSTSVAYDRGPLNIIWSTDWQQSTFLRSVEVEDAADYFPNIGPSVWTHNLSVGYEFSDNFSARVGVNNLTNEKPYITETSIPVSAVGRSFFLRGQVKF